jgi:uncharacterized membrane protein YoaK (UPF0700 family)
MQLALPVEQRALSLSVVLTLVAGFCDAATFVAADELFSAHVTGNFIVFAYDVVRRADAHAWLKLVSFPVFLLSIVVGRWIARRSANRYALLVVEGSLLLSSGLVEWIFRWQRAAPGLSSLIAMTIVFALGLQNTFGRLFSKETYGPTTVMTGNVTQAILDVTELLAAPKTETARLATVKNQTVIIAGFLVGCLLGALGGRQLGLGIVAVPGAILLLFASSCSQRVPLPGEAS